MLNLPGWMITIVTEFAPMFYGASTWYKAEVLLVGAILATGKRTVSAVLSVMGLSHERNYAKYHHVLSRAVRSPLDQRQWSDRAIARTTPILMGLFSLVTLLANNLLKHHDLPVRTTAWYAKSLPTFADALALVRQRLWSHLTFQMSPPQADMLKVPRALLERFNDLLCYAT